MLRAVSNLDQAKEIVERAIGGFGLDPNAARVEHTGGAVATYSLMRGSALTLVSVVSRDDGAALRVVCPVMTLPPADKHLACFKRLLEINGGQVVSSAAFALSGDRIVVVSERPVEGLDVEEATHVIKRASAVADTFDDRLVKEFGGQRASDAKT